MGWQGCLLYCMTRYLWTKNVFWFISLFKNNCTGSWKNTAFSFFIFSQFKKIMRLYKLQCVSHFRKITSPVARSRHLCCQCNWCLSVCIYRCSIRNIIYVYKGRIIWIYTRSYDIGVYGIYVLKFKLFHYKYFYLLKIKLICVKCAICNMNFGFRK